MKNGKNKVFNDDFPATIRKKSLEKKRHIPHQRVDPI